MKLTAQSLYELKESDPPLYDELIRKLRAEKRAHEEAPYVKDMFPAQLRFFKDAAMRKVALCGRRAGKSFAVACILISRGLKDPGGLSLYIASSRSQCRNIMWRVMIEINLKYNLGLHLHERDNQLTITLPNGHEIQLQGCKDLGEINKFRGLKCQTVAVDEAGLFPEFIRELVEDVLSPVLLDKQGQLILISTPGLIPSGLFYEITTGDGIGAEIAAQWSAVHHWTVLDNIYIPHAAEWLRQKRIDNQWTEEHPRYVREWMGRWVDNIAARPLPFDQTKNTYLRKPEGDQKWIIHMGIDVGFTDDTAITIAGYRRGLPNIYVFSSTKYHAMIPSALAVRVQQLKAEYHVSTCVIDAGGIGKAYAEEMSQRYGVHCESAEKQHKRAFIEIVRGEMISGVIRLNPRTCAPLITELRALVWNEDMSDLNEACEDHCVDSFLYLIRSLMPTYRPIIEKEPLTDMQMREAQMSKHRLDTIRQLRRNAESKMRNRSVYRDIANPL